jgi:hypothetical protein
MLRWQRRLDSAEEALRTEPCWPRTLSSEPRYAWMGRGAAGRVLVVKPMYNNDMGNDQEQVGAGSATGETGPA